MLREHKLLLLKLVLSVWALGTFMLPTVCESADTLRVDVETSARDPIIGKPFPLTIIVTWKGDADECSLLPVELPEKQGVSVVNSTMSSSRIGQTNRVEYVVQLSIDSKGETHLGTITVPYRTAGSEEQQSLQSDPVTVSVRTNPLPLQILMGAVAAGGLVGIVLLSRSVATSRRERRDEQRRADEQEQTQKLLQRIEQLRSLRVAGDLGGYLTGLADIAAHCGAAVAESSPYGELKRLAERAKFDGYHPSVEELDSSYRTVHRWVKRDAEQPSGKTSSASATNG